MTAIDEEGPGEGGSAGAAGYGAARTGAGADPNLRDRLVALTRDLILIPSTETQPESRQRCFEAVVNHLEGLEGVAVRTFASGGIPSLVAAPEGCEAPEVLLCGHLDVIAHPDLSAYRSEVRGGRIIGPGAGDMKGALAILLETFRRFHRRAPGIPLGIAVTSDEETGGEHGVRYLFDEVGLRCGLAMIPDGGGPGEVTLEEKGILHLDLSCGGRSAHAARPWLGENPVELLLERLGALRALFADLRAGAAGGRAGGRAGGTKDEEEEKEKEKEEEEKEEGADDPWYPTCSVTLIGTPNRTRNRVPSAATAGLDIRFPPPLGCEEMLGLVRGVLEPEVEVRVVIGADPTHLRPDPLFLEVAEAVTGRPVRLVRQAGGSDARFICQRGIPVLVSRPKVGNLHGDDEWIDIDSMVTFFQVYQAYLERRFALAGD